VTSANTQELKPDCQTGDRTPDTDETPETGGEAHERAGAREDSTPEPVHQGGSGPVSRSLQWIRGEFAAPQVWAESPASCRQLVAYAKGSPWADRKGAARTAGIVWCYGVAIPMTFASYLFAWATQRPSRFAVVVVLYIVLSQTRLGAAVLPPW